MNIKAQKGRSWIVLLLFLQNFANFFEKVFVEKGKKKWQKPNNLSTSESDFASLAEKLTVEKAIFLTTLPGV
ncbi:hypothetical protein FYJ61_04370 [Lactobacillus equicursoris]|uniref:Uncharacterized protein n=1 Tax=Lactobacillus equicursoris TaxID=420645 RepID=A0A844FMB5_9LACO|nr:hypothetical protein [Lactobacillus equicursoris]MST79721.1 hypothetical protein [Lactobacillus equicursoris]